MVLLVGAATTLQQHWWSSSQTEWTRLLGRHLPTMGAQVLLMEALWRQVLQRQLSPGLRGLVAKQPL